MRTITEIKEFILKNKSYGFDSNASDIQKGKIDTQIEFVCSNLRANEDVKFAVLTNGIYSGSRIVVGGRCILLITNERIIYGNKGVLSSTIKSVNTDDCRDVESDTFGIFRGSIKINTKTEIINFAADKSSILNLANMIEEALRQIADSKKTNSSVNINQVSAADELKKFKELLDTGIITQEEFNTKKKELLGL